MEQMISPRLTALNNERDCWVYLPPGYSSASEPYPLLVIFDGQWYNHFGGPPVILDNLLSEGKIPPMVAVLISSISLSERVGELSCNPDFLQFVTDEVLGFVRQEYRVTSDPTRVIVAGSSLGGLTSTYFGLQRPDVYGNILTQSGSFWHSLPDNNPKFEGMSRVFEEQDQLPLRFYMSAGSMEIIPFDNVGTTLAGSNRKLRDVLQAKGYPVQYSEWIGDHSYLCWRGDLSEGLVALIKDWK